MREDRLVRKHRFKAESVPPPLGVSPGTDESPSEEPDEAPPDTEFNEGTLNPLWIRHPLEFIFIYSVFYLV